MRMPPICRPNAPTPANNNSAKIQMVMGADYWWMHLKRTQIFPPSWEGPQVKHSGAELTAGQLKFKTTNQAVLFLSSPARTRASGLERE